MAQTVRYRVGTDRLTGRPLVGWPHVAQSLGLIWTTRVASLVMLLDFGSELRSLLAEDMTPGLALEIYDELVTAAHRHEPEYRVSDLQLVHLTRTGKLGLSHGGLYYPEGRLGNYAIAQPVDGLFPLAERERLARRRGAA